MLLGRKYGAEARLLPSLTPASALAAKGELDNKARLDHRLGKDSWVTFSVIFFFLYWWEQAACLTVGLGRVGRGNNKVQGLIPYQQAKATLTSYRIAFLAHFPGAVSLNSGPRGPAS